MELMKVPRVESKLRVFAFKITFSSQVCYLGYELMIIFVRFCYKIKSVKTCFSGSSGKRFEDKFEYNQQCS